MPDYAGLCEAVRMDLFADRVECEQTMTDAVLFRAWRGDVVFEWYVPVVALVDCSTSFKQLCVVVDAFRTLYRMVGL